MHICKCEIIACTVIYQKIQSCTDVMLKVASGKTIKMLLCRLIFYKCLTFWCNFFTHICIKCDKKYNSANLSEYLLEKQLYSAKTMLTVSPKLAHCMWLSINGHARILLPTELLKNLSAAWYKQAIFQIWWRLVHKSYHNLVHRCQTPDIRDRTSEIGDWTC